MLPACAVEWKKERMQEVENEVEGLARLVRDSVLSKLPSVGFGVWIPTCARSHLPRVHVACESTG